MSKLIWGRMGNVPVILTRWFLIIAIAYAIIFSAGAPAPFWPHQVVIAAILGSNLVLAWVLSRGKSWRSVSSWMTALDIAAVSLAISVAGNISAEFYLVYFSILILAAVIDGRGLLVFLTLIACTSYAILLWIDVGDTMWRSPALLVRMPVLFGVSLYFGTAVQTAKREQQRRADQLNLEREKALSTLTEMGKAALTGGYPGPVLFEIAGWVQEIVEFDRCSLLVFGEGGRLGYVAASGDDPSIEVRALDIDSYPELGPVLERGEYTEIRPGEPPDLWDEVRAHLPETSPFRAFVVVPITLANEVNGAFYLRDSDPTRRLNDAQTAFCFQAAHMAAAFIHQHDLLATLEERSRQDSLTGLMNYRTFIEQAEEQIRGAGPGNPLSLAVVNIDELSRVNKQHGHDVGTDLITLVGSCLFESLDSAAVCRYGGDEFIALIPGRAEETGTRLQRNFLGRLDEHAFGLPAAPRASIGVAEAPAHGENAEALFAAAHSALRTAKASGGHRVEISAGR